MAKKIELEPGKLPALTPKRALEVFKSIGPQRSLQILQDRLMAEGKHEVPPHGTFKRWSSSYRWRLMAHEYDVEVAKTAEQHIADEQARIGAQELVGLASKYRDVAHGMIDRLKNQLPTMKITRGGEARAVAEAATILSKAAEVLDGGVSDRTENRNVMTVEERKSAAATLVDAAFKNFQGGGQDNGKLKPIDKVQSVANAANARTGTDDL